MSATIEIFPAVDFIAEEMGKKIESFYPILQILKDAKEDSPEYNLLNKMWMNWCDYLES